MNGAGELEGQAVAAGKEQRHGRGAGELGDARQGGVPRRVCEHAAAPVQVRHFAGREGQQEPAPAQPGEAFAQRRRVGGHGAGVAEGIDKDTTLAQFRHRRKQRVSENPYVRPEFGKRVGKNGALQ